MVSKQIYTLKITLERSKPAIWRRAEVPGSVTLGDLHRILQGVMGWEEAHLHEFRFGTARRLTHEQLKQRQKAGGTTTEERSGQKRYADPLFELENSRDEWKITLAEAAPEPGITFEYLYDFGDGWQHTIAVEKIVPPEKGADYPRCTDGARRCPMEDSGSIFGWYEKLAIIEDPDHEEYHHIRRWMGLAPGESFDAKSFDVGETNARMVKMIRKCDRLRKKWLRDNGG